MAAIGTPWSARSFTTLTPDGSSRRRRWQQALKRTDPGRTRLVDGQAEEFTHELPAAHVCQQRQGDKNLPAFLVRQNCEFRVKGYLQPAEPQFLKLADLLPEFVGIASIRQEAPPQPTPYLAELGPHLDLMFDAGIPVRVQQGRRSKRSHLIHRVAGGGDLQVEQIREALEDRANGAARAHCDLRSRGHPGRMLEGQPEVSFDEPLPGPSAAQAPPVDSFPRVT